MHDAAHDFRIGEVRDVTVAAQPGPDQGGDIDRRRRQHFLQTQQAAALRPDLLAERPEGEAGDAPGRAELHAIHQPSVRDARLSLFQGVKA